METVFHLDYLSVTFLGNDYKAVWAEFFEASLGGLTARPFGGRRYKQSSVCSTGGIVYYGPAVLTKDGQEHFHIELKGESLRCLTPDLLQEYLGVVASSGKVTRIDFAFDHCDFTPDEIYFSVKGAPELLETKASRESLEWIEKEHQRQEGQADSEDPRGCHTMYIGSSQSERRLRIYDKHGYTRVELQLRAEWANAAALVLSRSVAPKWPPLAVGMLLDFVNVKLDCWRDQFENFVQCSLKVYSARAVSLDRAMRWLADQVAPALHTCIEVIGLDAVLAWVRDNLGKDGQRLDRWQPVLQMASPPL